VLCLAVGLAAACQDPPQALGPDNGVTVTNQPGLFRFQVQEMDNMIDDTSFTWVTADSQARILHRSLIPHGFAYIHVLDAKGVVVATSSLVYEADSLTTKGAPGPWTIQFEIKAATGKIDVTLEKP
jgi:hypothetical protein